MKKIYILFFYAIIFILSTNTQLRSHGLNYEFLYDNIGVKVYFQSNEPFSNADVTLYQPDNYNEPFVVSKTDKNGIFFFKPNKPGVWILIIRDKQGHGIRKNIEIDNWKDIISKMNVIISDEGILSQFDGYMKLKELYWEKYREKYGDIHRMDRILKSKGDSPDNYKVAKQADVLMIFYLLSPGEVKDTLGRMGYNIKDECEFMEKNYNFYIKRTSHGSTLSHVVHSAMLKYLLSHKKNMWNWFLNALKSDIYDTQGGTTTEGIHCGVMAGTVDIIITSFAGIDIHNDYIELEPSLPKHWNILAFKTLIRNSWLSFEITRKEIKIKCPGKKEQTMKILVDKKEYTLKCNELLKIPYKRKSETTV